MNPYVKQCESCADFNDSVRKAIKEWGFCTEKESREWYNFKDVKFFPAVRDTYKDGFISEAPDRYYCKDCIAGWGDASEGYSYEEWYETFEAPIRKEEKIQGRWITIE